MFAIELIKELNREKITYAIVGGYALAFHNIVRATMDIDLVLSLQEQDLKSCEKVLKKLGLQSRIPVNADEIAKFHEEYVANRNLIAWSFVDYKNPHKVVDILLNWQIDDLETELIKFSGEKICVATLGSLLKMKKSANRTQDQLDIKLIEEKLSEKTKN